MSAAQRGPVVRVLPAPDRHQLQRDMPQEHEAFAVAAPGEPGLPEPESVASDLVSEGIRLLREVRSGAPVAGEAQRPEEASA